MKTFINRFRWLYSGMWIGFAIAAWALSQDNEKKTINTPNEKFNDLYNHYKEKQNA